MIIELAAVVFLFYVMGWWALLPLLLIIALAEWFNLIYYNKIARRGNLATFLLGAGYPVTFNHLARVIIKYQA